MENAIDNALISPVRLCMREGPITASPLEPVSSLTYRMTKEDIGAVIVVEKGRPVGIITEKDVLEKVVTPSEDVYTTLARDVMSKPVFSIEASSPLKEALRLMKRNKIRRLAVVENESLVGLITERRVLSKIASLII